MAEQHPRAKNDTKLSQEVAMADSMGSSGNYRTTPNQSSGMNMSNTPPQVDLPINASTSDPSNGVESATTDPFGGLGQLTMACFHCKKLKKGCNWKDTRPCDNCHQRGRTAAECISYALHPDYRPRESRPSQQLLSRVGTLNIESSTQDDTTNSTESSSRNTTGNSITTLGSSTALTKATRNPVPPQEEVMTVQRVATMDDLRRLYTADVLQEAKQQHQMPANQPNFIDDQNRLRLFWWQKWSSEAGVLDPDQWQIMFAHFRTDQYEWFLSATPDQVNALLQRHRQASAGRQGNSTGQSQVARLNRNLAVQQMMQDHAGKAIQSNPLNLAAMQNEFGPTPHQSSMSMTNGGDSATQFGPVSRYPRTTIPIQPLPSTQKKQPPQAKQAPQQIEQRARREVQLLQNELQQSKFLQDQLRRSIAEQFSKVKEKHDEIQRLKDEIEKLKSIRKEDGD